MKLVPRPYGYVPSRTLGRRDWLDSFFADWIWPESDIREWNPVVDIDETDAEMVVTAELPGMKKEDIDVDVTGNQVTIRGEKKMEDEREEEDGRSWERFFGSFSRSIRLPVDVRSADAKATYKDGVLKLSIPKKEAGEKKRVEVQSG
jgi:HSP20 family protein